MVESAQFDARWAKRLYGMVELGKQLTWFLGGALGIALVLVTHNAVRMQILARRDEIEVAKLIGAPDSFIRRPFMYHAMWQGYWLAWPPGADQLAGDDCQPGHSRLCPALQRTGIATRIESHRTTGGTGSFCPAGHAGCPAGIRPPPAEDSTSLTIHSFPLRLDFA
jgi:hypothetical protein